MESLFLCSQKFQSKISWDHFLIWVLSSQKRMLSMDLSIVLLRERLKHFSEVNFPSKHHCVLLSVSTLLLIRLCVNCSIAMPSLKSSTEGPISLSVFHTLHILSFRVRNTENKLGRSNTWAGLFLIANYI